MPRNVSSLVPHLVARGDEDEGLGEAVIAAIVLAIVACCIPLAILLLRISRKSRLAVYVIKENYIKMALIVFKS
jgi:hypothetical protein